jgi:hypothetical protein
VYVCLWEDVPNELLYGRAGYLYALDFVEHQIKASGAQPLSAAQTKALSDTRAGSSGMYLLPALSLALAHPTVCWCVAVFDSILVAGEQLAAEWNPDGSPLMWEWHDSKYFGAAHGLTGILFHLLSAPYAARMDGAALALGVGVCAVLFAASERSGRVCTGSSNQCKRVHSLVFGTIDYLLTKRLSSGNYPTRDDSRSDELVHWCHGAPAFAFLFLRASQRATAAPQRTKYLDAARAAADVVWARGLLKTKGPFACSHNNRGVLWAQRCSRGLCIIDCLAAGPGLCHGIAGNGYVFLYLFHVTRVCAELSRVVLKRSDLLVSLCVRRSSNTCTARGVSLSLVSLTAKRSIRAPMSRTPCSTALAASPASCKTCCA